MTEADQIKRIMNTNLLPKSEPKEFGKDQSYELWSEGIKIDLVGYLPEAADIIKEIETADKLKQLKEMSEEEAYTHIKNYARSTKPFELVDSKRYTLLYRLVKHHPVASPRIKPAHKDNCGLYAWYLLNTFFFEQTQEFKNLTLTRVLNVGKCTTLNLSLIHI